MLYPTLHVDTIRHNPVSHPSKHLLVHTKWLSGPLSMHSGCGASFRLRGLFNVCFFFYIF